MAETLIEKEILGAGPGISFANMLINIPVKPRSVKVFVDYTTMVTPAIDNGAGIITGNGISGTINYSTGQISITVTTSVPAANQVYASYSYFEYGVKELNKVQYVQQDFQTLVEGLKSYINTHYREEYNDYATSSMGMALIDIIAYSHQNLAWYLNRKVTDLYFPTAKSPNAIAKLARLLGYKPRGATGSIVTVQVTLEEGPYLFPVAISAPFKFEGPNELVFEYRGSTPITYIPGEVLKVFDVYEGETVTESFVANGTSNQVIELLKVPEGKFVGESSIVVTVDGEAWEEYPIIPFQAEKYFEADIIAYPPTVKFGDGVQGLIPEAGAGISITYVIVNGFSGRVAKESVDDVVNSLTANLQAIPLDVYQSAASAGGDDPEDNRSITVNAPKFQKTQDRAITKEDYDFLVGTFPNVARSDTMVVRSIQNDVTIQNFIGAMDSIAAKLYQADRYLTPRPKIVTLTFSEDLFYGTEVSVTIDGVPLTQAFDTDNLTTLTNLAALIEDEPNIETAVVRSAEYGNVIAVTGIANADFSITALSVTAEGAPVIAKTEIQTAPNQVWRLVFDKDLFFGNRIDMEYSAVPISVPFDTDSITTLTNLADSLAGFAKAPKASINETSSSPEQITQVKFNKNFFKGCRINFYLKDLTETTIVESLVSVSFNTDNATTYSDCATSLEGLSFVESVTADAVARTFDIKTYAYSPSKIQNETLAFGDGVETAFSFELLNKPIRSGNLVIKAGAITGTDNGSGAITGLGITGSINYLTGVVSVTYSTAPAVAVEIFANYMFLDSSATLEVSRVEVLTNTVTVDEATRTLEIATDGANTLALTGEVVTAISAPSLTQVETQSVIEEDSGSVADYGDQIKDQRDLLTDYLNDKFEDGCNANVVQVSVLSKDNVRKYIAPPPSLLGSIQTYLDERKDVTHAVSVVSGFDKVIEVDITVEVQVAFESLEDVVVQNIENALKKSNAKPYGIMVEREFNKNLYISEVYEAIRSWLETKDYTYLNVVILGPETHSTGLIESVIIDVGDGNPGQNVSKMLSAIPVVKSTLTISVAGVDVATDNGSGEIVDIGAGYDVSGTINYITGELHLNFTAVVALDDSISATYYKNMVDSRGNYICPEGYVLQYGTVSIIRLSRL